MELQNFRLVVTEDDLARLIARLRPPQAPVSDLEVRLLPEGVRISGRAQYGASIAFRMLWRLGLRDGKLAAALEQFEAGGVAGAFARSLFLGALSGWAQNAPGCSLEENILLCDLAALLGGFGPTVKLNLKEVRAEAGRLILTGS
jgi:hypothetical protein